MKIKVRNRVGGRMFSTEHTCIDTWNEYFVDNRVSRYGDMTQFYRGGYVFMAIPNDDYIIVK